MKKRDLFFYMKIIAFLLFVMGSVFIALFQFDNRTLILKIFDSKGQSIYFTLSSYDIAHKDSFQLSIPEEEIDIERVKVYSDAILVKNWNFNQFGRFIDQSEYSWLEYSDKYLIITSNSETIQINFNQTFVESIRQLSESRLEERILLEQILIIFFSIILMTIKIISEKKQDQRYKRGVIDEAKRFFSDIKKYAYYIVYSAKTNLKAEVANSYLNRLWWLLEPLFNMMVYVIVFGQFMGKSITNYELFIFSARLMWNFFNKNINYSVKLVRSNRDILTKVYIPKFVILLSNIFLNLFKLLFSMIVLVAMLAIFKINIGMSILLVIPTYIILFLLSFGCGMILLHFGVFVDDLSYAVTILLNMVMYLSGVFYDMNNSLSPPFNVVLMYCNPVAILIDSMRNALLYNTVSNIPQLIIWSMISVILCCVGIHTVYKNENGYVKVV